MSLLLEKKRMTLNYNEEKENALVPSRVLLEQEQEDDMTPETFFQKRTSSAPSPSSRSTISSTTSTSSAGKNRSDTSPPLKLCSYNIHNT